MYLHNEVTVELKDAVTEEVIQKETVLNTVNVSGEHYLIRNQFFYDAPSMWVSRVKIVEGVLAAGLVPYAVSNDSVQQDWTTVTVGDRIFRERKSRWNARSPGTTQTVNSVWLSGTGGTGNIGRAYAGLTTEFIQNDSTVLDITYRIEFVYTDVLENGINFTDLKEKAFAAQISWSTSGNTNLFRLALSPHKIPDTPVQLNTVRSFGADAGYSATFSHPSAVNYPKGFCSISWSMSESNAVGAMFRAGDITNAWFDAVYSVTPLIPNDFPRKPTQTIFGHSANCNVPFQDVNFLASGDGTIEVDSSAWEKIWAEYWSVQISKPGQVGIARYTLRTAGFCPVAGNTWNVDADTTFSVPYAFRINSGTDGYVRNSLNSEYIAKNMFYMEGYSTFPWVMTALAVGVSLVNMETSEYVTFGDYYGNGPFTWVRQVAVMPNGDLWVADCEQGLWRIQNPLSADPVLTHMTVTSNGVPHNTHCYAVCEGYAGSIWAVFEGGLCHSQNNGVSWTTYTHNTPISFMRRLKLLNPASNVYEYVVDLACDTSSIEPKLAYSVADPITSTAFDPRSASGINIYLYWWSTGAVRDNAFSGRYGEEVRYLNVNRRDYYWFNGYNPGLADWQKWIFGSRVKCSRQGSLWSYHRTTHNLSYTAGYDAARAVYFSYFGGYFWRLFYSYYDSASTPAPCYLYGSRQQPFVYVPATNAAGWSLRYSSWVRPGGRQSARIDNLSYVPISTWEVSPVDRLRRNLVSFSPFGPYFSAAHRALKSPVNIVEDTLAYAEVCSIPMNYNPSTQQFEAWYNGSVQDIAKSRPGIRSSFDPDSIEFKGRQVIDISSLILDSNYNPGTEGITFAVSASLKALPTVPTIDAGLTWLMCIMHVGYGVIGVDPVTRQLSYVNPNFFYESGIYRDEGSTTKQARRLLVVEHEHMDYDSSAILSDSEIAPSRIVATLEPVGGVNQDYVSYYKAFGDYTIANQMAAFPVYGYYETDPYGNRDIFYIRHKPGSSGVQTYGGTHLLTAVFPESEVVTAIELDFRIKTDSNNTYSGIMFNMNTLFSEYQDLNRFSASNRYSSTNSILWAHAHTTGWTTVNARVADDYNGTNKQRLKIDFVDSLTARITLYRVNGDNSTVELMNKTFSYSVTDGRIRTLTWAWSIECIGDYNNSLEHYIKDVVIRAANTGNDLSSYFRGTRYRLKVYVDSVHSMTREFTVHSSETMQRIADLIDHRNPEKHASLGAYVLGSDYDFFFSGFLKNAQVWRGLFDATDIVSDYNAALLNKERGKTSTKSASLMLGHWPLDDTMEGKETKLTHSSAAPLYKGTTIKFNNGLGSTSFGESDRLDFALYDGFVKDNATVFTMKKTLFTKPTIPNFSFLENTAVAPGTHQIAVPAASNQPFWAPVHQSKTHSGASIAPTCTFPGQFSHINSNNSTNQLGHSHSTPLNNMNLTYSRAHLAMVGDSEFQFRIAQNLNSMSIQIGSESGMNSAAFNSGISPRWEIQFMSDAQIHVGRRWGSSSFERVTPPRPVTAGNLYRVVRVGTVIQFWENTVKFYEFDAAGNSDYADPTIDWSIGFRQAAPDIAGIPYLNTVAPWYVTQGGALYDMKIYTRLPNVPILHIGNSVARLGCFSPKFYRMCPNTDTFSIMLNDAPPAEVFCPDDGLELDQVNNLSRMYDLHAQPGRVIFQSRMGVLIFHQSDVGKAITFTGAMIEYK